MNKINKSLIAGNWVFDYIKIFISENKNVSLNQKTILKVEHMPTDFIPSIVESIENRKNDLSSDMKLVVKTVKKVQGFEHLALNEQETIVWLRNNIDSNQILVLIVNEELPESQSLKDIVAINESVLLSSVGLKALGNYLEELEVLSLADIDILKRFIKCYQEITDMQLFTLVDFISQVLVNKKDDIHLKIAESYPCLHLFKAKSIDLKNKQKFIKGLRKNYYLGSLRKSMTQILNVEKLMSSAEKFVANERKLGYLSPIWDIYNQDVALLMQDVEDFLYRKNKKLLQIDYNDAEKLFNFKENRKLKDKLMNVFENVQNRYDEKIQNTTSIDEKSNLTDEKLKAETEILEAINVIEDKSDLQTIREFREKYQTDLEEAGLIPSIKRIESKLETPSEYSDLINAVLSESVILLEGLDNENFENEISFKLKPRNSNISESIGGALNFHLHLLNALNKFIEVEKFQLDDAILKIPEEVEFELCMIIKDDQGNYISSEKSILAIDCTALNTRKTMFYEFLQKIKNKEELGYIEIKDGHHTYKTFEDNLKITKKLADMDDSSLKDHIGYFEDFLNKYEQILEDIINNNCTLETFYSLENLILNYLKYSYDNVIAVDRVHEFFNSIASVHVLDQNDQVKNVILTVFHPIRLISYISKFIRLEKIISELLDKKYTINRVSEVADMKKYREYLQSKLGEISPAYLVGKNSGAFYLLESEGFGEGIYNQGTSCENTIEKAELFSTEVQRVIKDYLNVYPFSKDCLNLLFMYVSNENYIIKSIDSILKNTDVKKLNISIYSKENSSIIYHRLSQWIKTREDLIVPLIHLGGLPKVEISVIPHDPNFSLLELAKNTLTDYDVVFFIDFLTQVSNSIIKKDFFDTEISFCKLTDHQWAIFDEIGYINSQGGARHINYVASELPEVLFDFYNLQYMINKKDSRNRSNKVPLLKAEITTAENEQNKFYEQMHELFNWVVAYDKYIDPLIAKQITTKAEIIKYSIVQKAQQDVKVLISSSESVNRSLSETDNYYYHDRLSNRLKNLLGIESIDEDVTRKIIQTVKEISGASVLRGLGAGNFMHELLSIYLTVSRISQQDEDKIIIWSSCDELDWFRTKSKRPDLLKIIIEPDIQNRKFIINFCLVELKLIHRQSYEIEKKDALKQLDSGIETLQKYFGNINDVLDKDNRLESFYKHLMYNRPYSPDELIYMNYLRKGSNWDIEFNFNKQADIYVYSHDDQFVDKKLITNGHYQDNLEEGLECNTFTRSYILNALRVTNEKAVSSVEAHKFTDIEEHLSKMSIKYNFDLNSSVEENKEKPKKSNGNDSIKKTPPMLDDSNKTKPIISEVESEQSNNNGNESKLDSPPKVEYPNIGYVKNEVEQGVNNYPEVEALSNFSDSFEPLEERMKKAEIIAKNFKVKLENGLRQNNINLTIKNTIIGANIIRFEGVIPVTEKFSSIKAKESDMAMWLQIPDAPRVMNLGKVVIDVNRQKPDTIYFKEFMQFVRLQLSSEDIEKKAIVPIGLSPLNEVMYMDLNDSIAHLLVAGTTGSGKSVSLNAMVLAMMCLYNENKLRFTFIDPKQVEFNLYKNVRHTDKVLTNLEETADYLEKVADLMDERYEIFSNFGVKNIASYNRRCKENNKSEMNRLIIVFDEFADFMIQEKEIAKRIKETIQRLGQKSRAAGIHLIICTQSPKADVIDTNIRNNLTGRICLRVSDSNASNVVIDEPGAEMLAGKGDYLMRGNNNRLERGMSPFLDDETLEELISYFKK